MKRVARYLSFNICYLFCIAFLFMCTKPEKIMLVTTTDITNILPNYAQAYGKVIDIGDEANQYGHCYSKNPGVTILCSRTQLGVPPGSGYYLSKLTGLESGTTYYVRAYISNGIQTVYGKETSFSTLKATVPILTTTAISSVTPNSAASGGNIDIEGEASVSSRGVCWNTTPNPTIEDSKTTDGEGSGSYASNLTGLLSNTLYYVRAYAQNIAGTAYGNELSFTTNSVTPNAPSAAVASATSVTNTGAILNGAANANGSSTTVIFEYGLTVLYGCSLSASPNNVTGLNPVNINGSLTGLTPGTLYHFRVKAVNPLGTICSGDMTFTTLQLPVVNTESATNITKTTATINGIVRATNLSTTVTFEYGPLISYGFSLQASPNPVNGDNPTLVYAPVTGLTPGTTYHFRMKAVNNGGTSYTEDATFKTLQLPTAQTTTATSITKSTAILNGIVNPNGSSTIVTFVYGLTTSYGSTATALQSPLNGSVDAVVSAAITGLNSFSTYHYRVKAVSDAGTIEGGDLTFKTSKY